MAIYEYACLNCEKRVTIQKPMYEASREESCPTCAEPLERVYSPSRPIVKGGTPTFGATWDIR